MILVGFVFAVLIAGSIGIATSDDPEAPGWERKFAAWGAVYLAPLTLYCFTAAW